MTPGVKGIIIACVVIYLVQQVLPGAMGDSFV